MTYHRPTPTDIGADIEKIATEALEEWWTEWSTSYKEDIKALMDKGMKDNMFRVLGFEPSWGNEWRVCQTNGNSNPVADHLKAHARERVDEFLDKVLDFIPAEPSEKLREGAIKIYEEEFQRCLRDAVKARARDAASIFANELVSKLQFDSILPKGVAIEDAEERLATDD